MMRQTAKPGGDPHDPAPGYVPGGEFQSVFAQEMTQWVIPAAEVGDRPPRRREPQTGDALPSRYTTQQPDQGNDLVGLAISGGGIRAATFGLGVLQAMARERVLDRVDYLSTVSGGGYIGSAVSALLHHRAQRQATAKVPLRGRPLDRNHAPFVFNPTPMHEGQAVTFKQEDPTVRHLREQSNYLAPRLGIFDAQTWQAVLRLVTYMILTAVLLGIPPILLAVTLLSDIPNARDCLQLPFGVCFGWDRGTPMNTPWVLMVPGVAAGAALLASAALSTVSNADNFQRFRGVQQALLFVMFGSFLWLSLVFGIQIQQHLRQTSEFFETWWGGGLGSTIAAIVTLGLQAGLRGSDAQSVASPSLLSRLLGIASMILFAVVGYLALYLFVLFLYEIMWRLPGQVDVAVSALCSLWILILLGQDRIVMHVINQWSLHSFYRDRLKSAFLMRERTHAPDSEDVVAVEGRADAVLHDLQRDTSDLAAPKPPYAGGAPWGPYHVLMTAINFAGSTDVRYLGRKADSFGLAPLYAGSSLTGYVPTQAGYPDLTLATAMAISGAAASPNMGTYTSTSLSILMTALNARLGYWLRNPRALAQHHTMLRRPPALWYFTREMFGNASSEDEYVYLSDGGHFDNSALYELIRRRCRYIIAIDSAGEPSPVRVFFDTIGTAARLARIDFGVEIELDLAPVTPDPLTGRTPANYTVGTITYPPVPRAGWTDAQIEEDRRGILIFIRSTLTKNPHAPDLESYRLQKPVFPSHSTADQFFDEVKFEAYRHLGYQIGRAVFRDAFRPNPDTGEQVDDATGFTRVQERSRAFQRSLAGGGGINEEDGDRRAKLETGLLGLSPERALDA